jgi:hypothetical protein
MDRPRYYDGGLDLMEIALAGMDTVVGNLNRYIESKIKQTRTAAKLGGQAYANDVKVLAPYKTGDYRRSIHVKDPETNGLRTTVMVGTDKPQGRRLEFGFFDMTDSLGRHFFQYPRPHFRPPFDTERARYLAIMAGELQDDSDYLGQKLDEWSTNMRVAGDIGLFDTSDVMNSMKASALGSVRPDLTSFSSFGYESTPWGAR